MISRFRYIIMAVAAFALFTACDNELIPADPGQRPATINVSGYSESETLQLVFNGEPVEIDGEVSYMGRIETILEFVVDKDETNTLDILNKDTGSELATYEIGYDNIADTETLNFYNLPEIFLEALVEKPAVRLGYVGYEFIFPNLGEFSGFEADSVRGVLKKADGTVLADFSGIGRRAFTEVEIYRSFNARVDVYLDLYKQDSEEPYTGTQPVSVAIKQDSGPNLIVLQEYTDESGNVAVKGDIDIVDYL